MWTEYINAASVEQTLSLLAERGSTARIVAGATDLLLEMERGQRKGITTLIDVSRIPGLDQITLTEDAPHSIIHLGAMVTHNQCVGSALITERAFPLACACWEVGSPQIRNRGTVAGNLITASPANDTISPLMALNAQVTLRSVRGERTLPLAEFYTGVRRTVMQPDEMMVDIAFPAMQANEHGTFVKFALRRAQAISLLNVSVVVEMQADRIESAVITLGAVTPVIIHATKAEEFLAGKTVSENVLREAAELAMQSARPISDLRSSANYRQNMVRVCTLRALQAATSGKEKEGFPTQPVLLRANLPETTPPVQSENQEIVTRVNGKEYRIQTGQHKTLLRFLRDEIGLIGTKEGCAEGECGACTVFLDGQAVMACMVPAPRAHGAEITTIEGLAEEGRLHVLQQAFIDEGAVQCGYCTPGLLMSTAKLLEERAHPDRDMIRQAITGNLCRCTGYYKIIQAVERAAAKQTVLPEEG